MDRKRVDRILRACVAQRERENLGRLPGQTERLCRALLMAWDEAEAARPRAPGPRRCECRCECDVAPCPACPGGEECGL